MDYPSAQDGIFAFQSQTFDFRQTGSPFFEEPFSPRSYSFQETFRDTIPGTFKDTVKATFQDNSTPRSVTTHPAIHPSILAARNIISSLPRHTTFPQPSLPRLNPEQQHTLLTALANLYPPATQHFYLARQIKSLPPPYAKALLTYQTRPDPDPRLLMFPIAILRATIVAHLDQHHHPFDIPSGPPFDLTFDLPFEPPFDLPSNPPFNLTAFINATLSHARVFGNPLDPEGWEMPDQFWEEWGDWFPPGQKYCASLKEWRRRDGHGGSTVWEMIMGMEGEKGRRREDPVGWPEGWKPPSEAVKQREVVRQREEVKQREAVKQKEAMGERLKLWDEEEEGEYR